MRLADKERRALIGMMAAGVLVAALPRAARANDRIIVVSRERVLREVEIARYLREAEGRLTRQLQVSVDEAKAQFAIEEEQLSELRAELDSESFAARAQDFDRRIRAVRRETQERATFLQRGFQEARAAIVAALPGLLERVRVEHGARLILNADQVLAVGEGVDVTDTVIALMDAEGPRPLPPKIDLSRPLLAPPADPVPGATEDNQ